MYPSLYVTSRLQWLDSLKLAEKSHEHRCNHWSHVAGICAWSSMPDRFKSQRNASLLQICIHQDTASTDSVYHLCNRYNKQCPNSQCVSSPPSWLKEAVAAMTQPERQNHLVIGAIVDYHVSLRPSLLLDSRTFLLQQGEKHCLSYCCIPYGPVLADRHLS